jgi:hypothetical protein
LSRPLVDRLHDWLSEERAKLSRHNKIAKAINYMFEKKGRWQAFTAFLDDGRICLTNNSAERALRGVAMGRKSWLFAGSERGGQRAAAMYTLIVTAKMNDIDPQHGSPTCSPGCPTCLPHACMSFSCGTGRNNPSLTPRDQAIEQGSSRRRNLIPRSPSRMVNSVF